MSITKTVSLPGYLTVREVGIRLKISASRVRQILQELRVEDLDVGYLVGTGRFFSALDVAHIERIHAKKRKYNKNEKKSVDTT